MNLADMWQRGKSLGTGLLGAVLGLKKPLFLAACGLLLLPLSFGGGVLFERERQVAGTFSIKEVPVEGIIQNAAAAAAAHETLAPTTLPKTSFVFAAKTGTKYYYPWCGGIKRVKPENLISFATSAEAEAKGYSLAANCAP